MRIGIFGGTFDPPHLGHLILAGESCDQLRLDRLLWVLTADPPHKQGHPVSPLQNRLDLVLAAIQDNPVFELSRVDIDRPGPHYAVDTVQIVAHQFPHAELFYLMGGDSLHDLPDWHRPMEFLRECTGLGVFRRPGDGVDLSVLEMALPGIGARLRFIEAPLLEISSSEVRERVRLGRPFRYYLPSGVYALIQSRRIYQE